MAMGAILLIAQATAVSAAPATVPPDIELSARLHARAVRIQQDGPIVLRLEVEPGITDVAVTRNQPGGATTYRNLTIDARVAAWLRPDGEQSLTLSTKYSTGEPPQ